jgi:hypothetical protein
VEPKHHLLPQFFLRRFALDGQVGQTDRGLRWRIVTSVERAAREGGFYTLGQEIPIPHEDEVEVEQYPPLADILERTAEGSHVLGSQSVEKMLGVIEDTSKPAIERLVSGSWPPSTDDRLHVGLFIAMQFTRGRLFREEVDGMIRATQRAMIERSPDHYRRKWEEFSGSRASDGDDPLSRLLEGLERISLSQDNKLGMMLAGGMEIAPWIAARTWRLLCLDDPNFVISDEPVALWTRKDRLQTHGVATADLIYVPVDARHCLQLVKEPSAHLPEVRVDGTPKTRQANNVVAANAHRWIWYHPDCKALDDLVMRETRGQFVAETVATAENGDERREIIRFHRERF